MGPDQAQTQLERGAQLIRCEVEKLKDVSGVYRMLGHAGDVLYVGKARSLKKRVLNYTQTNRLPLRLQRMVAETHQMEFIQTRSEAEALLLESNLIKTLKPVYNILLKDDKSYPYILLTKGHDYPQILKFRGKPDNKGIYFGPFASTQAVNETLDLLQRVFLLRNCSDSYFQGRKRPCLQYHIKRCTAPCVGMVSESQYAEQVADARSFLSGKSREVQERLQGQMLEASIQMDYERAAFLRDRIKILTQMQSKQRINGMALGDADLVAVEQREGKTCVQIFFFRGGQSYGNRTFFPVHAETVDLPEIMANFLAQFYEGRPVPPEIIVNVMPEDAELLEEALSKTVPYKLHIQKPHRGIKHEILDIVIKNVGAALSRHIIERQTDGALLEKVAELFGMDSPPQRIEVYDNSHASGTNMVGGMIVAGPEGFDKKSYRKFNIKMAKAADDYGMMREVMERRFSRILKEEGEGGNPIWPDLLLIDGGLGQLGAVMEVLMDMGISDRLTVVGIAKGEDRNAGREKFFLPNRDMFQLPLHDPTLHYLQRLRDEAHRFAIGSHRIRRSKAATASMLDDVPGVGPKRKKALVLHFGSAKAVQDATIEDLMKVEGISQESAKNIYEYFHSE